MSEITMSDITLNQIANSSIFFDPGTIYAEIENGTYLLKWDGKRSCFVDEYNEWAFAWETVYNAPITCIDSKQGYGNTLCVTVKLS